jgi:alpha-glucosidase (family GH31 glycosyl hydrolase)
VRHLDDQYLLGENLLVAPAAVDSSNQLFRDIYFPGDTLWYSWWRPDVRTAIMGPTAVNMSTPIEFAPVYIRGGAVLPTVIPSPLRGNHLELVVALSPAETGSASGSLFLDDGVSTDPAAPNVVVQFVAGDRQLTSTPTSTGTVPQSLAYPSTVDQIVILGVEVGITAVVLEVLDAHGGIASSWVIPKTDDDAAVVNTSNVNVSVKSMINLQWTI